MRLMASRATLKAYRRVLEGERPAFIAMAFEAAGLIDAEALGHGRTYAAMRVVAFHAGHGALAYAMMERFLELYHHLAVTTGALFVHRRRLGRHLFRRTV